MFELLRVKSSSFFQTSKSSFDPELSVEMHKSTDDGISKLSTSFTSFDIFDLSSIDWSHEGAK